MGEAITPVSRYRLSFSVGGLFLGAASIAAPLYFQSRDWQAVRAAIDASNLLQARTVASGRRLSRELVQRLAELTDDELELLIDATATERGHVMWVAACRRYELVGEFAEEVVRERFLLLTPMLLPEHFVSFVQAKSMWHEELSMLADSTLRKLRTTVYLMLREAGLLSKAGEILPCVLSPRVAEALRRRRPSDVRFFPTTAAMTGGGR
ncbi:DUF1819 family protein [Catellatospora sp. NPDC049133]|uniref:DUF1819 family protein n=1 Tax=Catellatospora sp. NPDC049133 TaxID=3155499 RepID=UPI0033D2282F